MDGFGIIGVFINTFADIGFHHIVKHLKNIAYHDSWIGNQFVEKLLEWNRSALFLGAHAVVEIQHCFFNAILSAHFLLCGLFLFSQSTYGFFHLAHEVSPVLACCSLVNF